MAKAVDAGRAVLQLTLDDRELKEGFAKAQRQMRNVAAGVRSAAVGLGAVGAAITAPLGAAVAQFVQVGDQLNKMSARTGASVEALSKLKFAAEQSGSSIEQLGSGLFRMRRRIANATMETGPAVRALNELGLEAESLNQLTSDEQLRVIADALVGVGDEAKAAQLGFEILGDGFKALAPLLAEGSAGIDKLTGQAEDLGITMSTESAQAAADLGDAFNRMTKTAQALALEVGAALAPALIVVADWMQSVVRIAVDFIRENKVLVVILGAIGGALVVLASAGLAASAAIAGLSVALGAFGTILTFLTAHPFIAVMAGLAATALAIATYFGWISDNATEAADNIAAAKAEADQVAQQNQAAQARAASQMAAIQPELNQIAQVAGPAGPVATQATDTDRRMLEEIRTQTRILVDIVQELRDSGGVAVGAG